MANDANYRHYRVVFNSEHQYSLWFVEQQLPLGWHDAGKTGTKQECLNYIKTVWTDITPLSARNVARREPGKI